MEATNADTEREALDLLTRWYAAWNAHDPEAICALCTEDIVYEDPGATEPLTRGREALRAWAETALRAVPDMHLELKEAWVSPGGAVAATYFHFTATLTGPLDPPGLAPTNGCFASDGMDRNEVRDGLISRHQIFWDILERSRVIGVSPPRGSALERVAFRAQHLTARRMRAKRR